ncbi:MAG: hypothetical protein RL122_1574 [Pseudomonadota bacterium]|jgi:hypothetical protein
MAMTFHLDVVTAEQQLFSGMVEEVMRAEDLVRVMCACAQVIQSWRAGFSGMIP